MYVCDLLNLSRETTEETVLTHNAGVRVKTNIYSYKDLTIKKILTTF